jgi:subtilisin-like proprotein convertase family protein
LSDLTLSLKAPDGTVVPLSNRSATGSNLQETVFDDVASRTLRDGAAPYTGTFRPDGKLSTFKGKNALGTWQIIIQNATPSTRGRVNIVTLNFSQAPATQTATFTETLPASLAQGSSFLTSTNAFQSGAENVPLLLGFFQEQNGTPGMDGTTPRRNWTLPELVRARDALPGRVPEAAQSERLADASYPELGVPDRFEEVSAEHLMACFESFSEPAITC